jgi:hypothetical protein
MARPNTVLKRDVIAPMLAHFGSDMACRGSDRSVELGEMSAIMNGAMMHRHEPPFTKTQIMSKDWFIKFVPKH